MTDSENSTSPDEEQPDSTPENEEVESNSTGLLDRVPYRYLRAVHLHGVTVYALFASGYALYAGVGVTEFLLLMTALLLGFINADRNVWYKRLIALRIAAKNADINVDRVEYTDYEVSINDE